MNTIQSNNDPVQAATMDELTAQMKAIQELLRQKRMQERLASPSYIVRAMPDEKGAELVKLVIGSVVGNNLPTGLSIWLNRAKHYFMDAGELGKVSVDVPQYGRVQVYTWKRAPAVTDAEALASWKMSSNARKTEIYSHAVKLGLFAPIRSADGLIGPGTDGTEVKTV
jgi:hypothetical protein